MDHVRPAVLSGSWYPGDADQLAKTVREFVASADLEALPEGRPVVAVVPHAGYVYSGAAAGKLYGLLAGLKYERVFILAPSHRTVLQHIALSSATAFAIPDAVIPVDREVTGRLGEHASYQIDDTAHVAEHAVEIQLPFLHEVFGSGLTIVPMLVPPHTESWLRDAAQALTPWCDGRSLLLVSTDFTHYGMTYGYVPFSKPSAEKLAELDGGAIDSILARNPAELLKYGERTGITMCGMSATALALSAPWPSGGESKLVDYRRSGDRDRDYSMSVSYASLMVTIPEPTPDPAHDGVDSSREQATHQNDTETPGAQELTTQEKQILLSLARAALTAAVQGKPPLDPWAWLLAQNNEPTANLQEKRGAFVTLTCHGNLRGCIGFIEPIKALGDAVAENAVAAATRDLRFSPVSPAELSLLHLEISALTPLRSVPDYRDIVLGRDGILLNKGAARAVFLPQVATEQGWDLETTLSHLSLKAGLGPDEWREGVAWQVFNAEVFGEKI